MLIACRNATLKVFVPVIPGVEDHSIAPQAQAAQQQADQIATEDSFDLLNSPSQPAAASSASVSPSRGASSTPARQPVSPAPQPASRGQSPSSRPSAAAEASPARTARPPSAAAPAPDQALAQERPQPTRAGSGSDISSSRERRPADRRPPLADSSPGVRLSKAAAKWQVGMLCHSLLNDNLQGEAWVVVCLH